MSRGGGCRALVVVERWWLSRIGGCRALVVVARWWLSHGGGCRTLVVVAQPAWVTDAIDFVGHRRELREQIERRESEE